MSIIQCLRPSCFSSLLPVWQGLCLCASSSFATTSTMSNWGQQPLRLSCLRGLLFSIPYGGILRVERVSFVQAIFSFALGLVNRPFGEYFLLHRTRGLLRRIVVTPSGSDEFYNTLMMKLGHLPTVNPRR